MANRQPTTPTRRRALAAAATAAPAASALLADDPDAELHRLHDAIARLDEECGAATNASEKRGISKARARKWQKAADAAFEKQSAALDRLVATKATTPRGVLLKLETADLLMHLADNGTCGLVHSALADLRAMTAG